MERAAERLRYYMSDLSEMSYCAGWMEGLEYVLWKAVIGGPRKYGFLEITDEEISKLKELSDDCGGWIIFDDDKGEIWVQMEEWLRIYERNQDRLPAWV